MTMRMRFPRTIRLDGSDEQVFEKAAAAGELAVSGGFAFADAEPAELTGKARQAFRNGFLGLESFGRSTLAAVAEIDEAVFEEAVEALSRHLLAQYGAPDIDAARAAGRAEARFAAELCEHPVNTLLTVSRSIGAEGVVEQFGTLEPSSARAHARIWEIVADDDDGG